MLGMIRTSSEAHGMDSFRLLYKYLVRAHLECCNVIVYPHFEKQANVLQDIPRSVTKLVPEINDMSETDKLERLDLPSLYHRRNGGDTIEV